MTLNQMLLVGLAIERKLDEEGWAYLERLGWVATLSDGRRELTLPTRDAYYLRLRELGA